MNPVLADILESGHVTADNGVRLPVHSQIPRGEGDALTALVEQVAPTRSVEIGLAYGVSSLFICDALAAVGAERHWVVDPLQFGQRGGDRDMVFEGAQWQDLDWSPETGWRGIGLANLRRAGFGDLVEHLNAPSHLALPPLIEAGERIDFAFIDGWHTFDYVLADFFLIDMLLNEGGVIAFDDASNPAIHKVLRYVLSNRHYEVIDGQRTAAPARSALRDRVRAVAHRLAVAGDPYRKEPLVDSAALGLPTDRFVAVRKLRHDVLGDGQDGSRRWNDHTDF